MCLALIAFAAHPRYRMVVAANRDEFHARSAAPSAWWADGFLAGRDLKAGGTWLGVNRDGRFALLTNVREPWRHDPRALSRGTLVPNLLTTREPLTAALPAQVQAGAAHNGFNLVAGDLDELLWGSNRAAAPLELKPGVYGVSNHLLDTPWPKLERTKAAFRHWCGTDNATDDLAPVLALLHDTERAPDAELPATGVSLERERMLSAPFIVGATTARAARPCSRSRRMALRTGSSAASIRAERRQGTSSIAFRCREATRRRGRRNTAAANRSTGRSC
jgi:uncharacterized protein with NRDE domain